VPKDIASLVSYLSSEQNSFITGSIINIDGGEDKSL
jgi:NAD(P)-dependent dehydrogenase (short-subunit alcohol dehydrogenase family)